MVWKPLPLVNIRFSLCGRRNFCQLDSVDSRLVIDTGVLLLYFVVIIFTPTLVDEMIAGARPVFGLLFPTRPQASDSH